VTGQRPTRVIGLNIVGLRRNGFPRERIEAIKGIFKTLLYEGLNTTQALERIEAEIPPSDERREILAFVRSAKRGIVKKTADVWDRE
jgi:UDP-N-acetylglucosamine acyltransferase